MRRLGFVLLVLFLSTRPEAANVAQAGVKRPNVLFIAVDDLRPQLGCYGQTKIISPNIDRLAAGGTLFQRSYCMVPTCGASRASLMTGIRPARHRFVTFHTRADEDAPGITTLNTHFQQHGYYTVSNGKVLHVPADNEQGWSEKPWRPSAPTYQDPENLALARQRKKELGAKKGRGGPFEHYDVADNVYADGLVAEKTIADLRRLKELDQPFFLATGFFKPHLPFVSPERYWSQYDHADVHLPSNYFPPKNAPEGAVHNFGELRSYAGIPAEGLVSDEMALNLIHGYYGCVSYTDAQVGKVLDELDRLGLAENTIVILWGDHGWQLGEHTMWCKHCTFETSMRAPLIVRAPGFTAGQTTTALTEFIDIYPSLCELTGLPLPQHLQGTSFVPLLRDPQAQGKEFAIGRFTNGDTIRTDRYRYTEYADRDGKLTGTMLYDHQVDPDENENIVDRPELQALVKQLSQQLRENMGKDQPR